MRIQVVGVVLAFLLVGLVAHSADIGVERAAHVAELRFAFVAGHVVALCGVGKCFS